MDEKALFRVLQEGRIAGAALDVFGNEPEIVGNPLLTLPNVIVTPRIAGITSEKWPAVLPVFKDNLRRFLGGEPLCNVVDKELGY